MRGVLVTLMLILISGRAHAGGIGFIVAAPESDRPAVTAAMADAARPQPVIPDAVGAARLAEESGAVGVDQMARFRRVREEIDEGWRAYHNVQSDFATQRLVAARQDAESALALPGMAMLYADASLRLGAVLAQLGRTQESHDAIALALALDPDRPITQLEFSPELIATVDAVRAQPRPTRSVKVTSEPPGAVINIDGRDAGRAPFTADLGEGQHVVIARAPQFVTHAQALLVDEKAQIAMVLDRDDVAADLERGVAIGMSDAALRVIVDQVQQLADLDEVVLVASTDRRGGPTLLVQRCAGNRCTAVVELGYADRSGIAAAARSAWQALRTADLRYPPTLFGDERLTGAVVDHRCKLCRNPIVLTSAGVVLVAATVAIILAVSSSHPPPILGVDSGMFTHP